MPRAHASGVVAAPVAAVWSVVRDFDGLPTWMPGIRASNLEGANYAAGTVRRLTLANGGQIAERLVSIDDRERLLSYEFAGPNPFGVTSYLSSMRVSPITDSDTTLIEWWADFDAEAAAVDAVARTLTTEVYAVGVSGLRSYLEARR